MSPRSPVNRAKGVLRRVNVEFVRSVLGWEM